MTNVFVYAMNGSNVEDSQSVRDGLNDLKRLMRIADSIQKDNPGCCVRIVKADADIGDSFRRAMRRRAMEDILELADLIERADIFDIVKEMVG